MPTVIADYVRSPSENIREGISRPLEYHAVDGSICYQSDNERFDVTFAVELDKANTARRLRAATSRNSDFIYGLLDIGKDTLLNTRLEQPNAAMLVIADDKESAYSLAKHSDRSGLSTVVLTEDDPNPRQTLKEFKEGKGDVLIAVAMMTEGANVPRLRVGVYATKKKAPLFLQQVLHRLSRKEHPHQEGSGKWIGPSDPDILEEARTVSEVNMVTFMRETDEQSGEVDRQGGFRPLSSFVPISAYTTSITGFSGDLVAMQHELKRAKELRKNKPSLYAGITDVQLGKIAAELAPVASHTSQKQIENYDEVRQRLGRTASQLANRLAWMRSVEPREVHLEWIANGNRRHDDADNTELQKKVDWLAGEIEREQIGRPDLNPPF